MYICNLCYTLSITAVVDVVASKRFIIEAFVFTFEFAATSHSVVVVVLVVVALAVLITYRILSKRNFERTNCATVRQCVYAPPAHVRIFWTVRWCGCVPAQNCPCKRRSARRRRTLNRRRAIGVRFIYITLHYTIHGHKNAANNLLYLHTNTHTCSIYINILFSLLFFCLLSGMYLRLSTTGLALWPK